MFSTQEISIYCCHFFIYAPFGFIFYYWYRIFNAEYPQIHTFFFIRILFIRIIRLKSENSKNDIRIILRVRSCCCSLKGYFCPIFSYKLKVKNHLRIFPGWIFEGLRIPLRLPWKILIHIKKMRVAGIPTKCSQGPLAAFFRSAAFNQN